MYLLDRNHEICPPHYITCDCGRCHTVGGRPQKITTSLEKKRDVAKGIGCIIEALFNIGWVYK